MEAFLRKLQYKAEKRLGDSQHQSSDGVGRQRLEGVPSFPIDRPDDALPVIPQPGQRPPGPGRLPPRVTKRTYHDRHQFYHPKGHCHATQRDLGFTGVLAGKIVWSWGDTLMGPEGDARICAVDAVSIGSMRSPMSSMDTSLQPGTDNVASFIPLTDEEANDGGYSCYSFGGTNIVEVGPNAGVVYYLKVHRPGGVYSTCGAGVATCAMTPGSVPEAQRVMETMWNAIEPCWGDVGIALNAADGKVYVYGHGSAHDPELNARTYLARCPKDSALDVSSYEYWRNDTREWTSQRLANGQMGTLECTREMAIFDWHAMNQSAPFWSNHYNCWMFLHSTEYPDSPVYCKTADRLEGPWTDHGEVATTWPEGQPEVKNGNGMRYCVCPHPEFDASGKTVLVTWTRDNVIWGVTLEFD